MVDLGSLIAGRYELLAPLGGGGGGLVYKAFDRTTDNLVAVKLVHPHLLLDPHAREKFELEVRIAGRVRSEHLVKVVDAGLDPDSRISFLVMEYLEGTTLQDLVDRYGALDLNRAVEYLRQVAFGLDKVHAHRDVGGRPTPMVHRDLKPSNLMLTVREDDTPLVKILDWGIAKLLSNQGTTTYAGRGTPLYMAPEQMSPTAQLTPATDVFAMGLVAFFLLSGRSYWRAGQRADLSLVAIANEVCAGPVVRPRARLREFGVVVDLPAAFDDWFAKCLSLDQDRRYQSAGKAARELATALAVAIRESRPPDIHSDAPRARAIVSSPRRQFESSKRKPRDRFRRVGFYFVGFSLGTVGVLSVAFVLPNPIRVRNTPPVSGSAAQRTMMALPIPSMPGHAPVSTATSAPVSSASLPIRSAAPASNPPRVGAQPAKQGIAISVSDDLLRNDELREAAQRERGFPVTEEVQSRSK